MPFQDVSSYMASDLFILLQNAVFAGELLNVQTKDKAHNFAAYTVVSFLFFG